VVADAAGDLYVVVVRWGGIFADWDTGDWFLVSLSAKGIRRFDAATGIHYGGAAMPVTRDPVVAGDRVLLAGSDGESDMDWKLRAYRTGDGTALWSTRIPAQVAPMLFRDASNPTVGNGTLLETTWYGSDYDLARRTDLFAFDLGTGNVIASRSDPYTEPLSRYPSIADAAGNFYFYLPDGILVGISPSGQIRFQIPGPGGEPIAVGGGILLTASGDLRRTSDGAKVGRLGRSPGRPLLSSGKIWSLACHLEAGACTSTTSLAAYRAQDGAPLWERPISTSPMAQVVGPVATSQGSVLFAWQQNAGEPFLLQEVDAAGRDLVRCLLPADDYRNLLITQGAVYLSGKSAVRAWSSPGRALATEGWVTQRGDAGGGNRAR
jgi:outer membrane protein assembly factor BamB